MTDGIPPRLQSTPLDPRKNNNLIPPREPYVGQKIQNEGNIPTILKNPGWSSEKYSVVEELKKTKENISMFKMLQSFPNQREALLKTLDHSK